MVRPNPLCRLRACVELLLGNSASAAAFAGLPILATCRSCLMTISRKSPVLTRRHLTSMSMLLARGGCNSQPYLARFKEAQDFFQIPARLGNCTKPCFLECWHSRLSCTGVHRFKSDRLRGRVKYKGVTSAELIMSNCTAEGAEYSLKPCNQSTTYHIQVSLAQFGFGSIACCSSYSLESYSVDMIAGIAT